MTTPRPLTPRFDAALTYASALHRPQPRKGTDIPYVSHLLAVASLVLEHGGGESEAIAALLHDAVEDGGTYPPGGVLAVRREIGERFGEEVLAIVEGCTDAHLHPKPSWPERKRRYIEHLATASPSARLVSGADKLHNARCILADYRVHGEDLWSRFNPESNGREGQLWYYRELVTVFARCGPGPLADELARTVAELERLVSEFAP